MLDWREFGRAASYIAIATISLGKLIEYAFVLR
jgi:hypothetical protein